MALLVLFGAGWGATLPLAKIAVSGGYRPFGLIFWELVIGAAFLGAVLLARGKRVPLGRASVGMYLAIALVGTLFPSAASYQAAIHLPSGILAIFTSLVPMIAFPIALLFAVDRFSWTRLLGLAFGLAGVAVIVGPEASLPERAMVAFIPLALVAPFFYGLEGSILSRWGHLGPDPVTLLFGASVVGMALALPLAVLSGQFIDPRPPWGLPDLAFALAGLIHAAVYAGYVWIVGRAGAVFAAQVSYLVTGFGVLWAMALLGERFSAWIWVAMAMMFAGLFLVQPRQTTAIAVGRPGGNDAV